MSALRSHCRCCRLLWLSSVPPNRWQLLVGRLRSLVCSNDISALSMRTLASQTEHGLGENVVLHLAGAAVNRDLAVVQVGRGRKTRPFRRDVVDVVFRFKRQA